MASVSALARRVSSALVAPSASPLLPWVPKYIKVLFLLLILLNSSSFPFMWHWRVWKHPLAAMLQARIKGTQAYWRGWREEYDRRGGIAHMRTKVWRHATPDDCDYNMHLSNSCYAKGSDASKMKLAIDIFAPSFVTGIHMALGASHWQYLKEIPIGSQYCIESRMAGWGDKWLHIVTEFVIYPKHKRASRTVQNPSATVVPSISMPPSGTDSGADTPVKASAPAQLDIVKALLAKAREPRSDGGVVCCIAVTDYVFKHGRITVPPRIAMHVALLSADEGRRAHALRLLTGKDKGAAFVRGGWKEEADAEVFGTDVGLVDGSQEWAEDVRRNMDMVNEGFAGVALMGL